MKPNVVILNTIFIPGMVTHMNIDNKLYVQELFRVVNMADQQHQCWDQWDSVNQVFEEQYPNLHYDIVGDITNTTIQEATSNFDQTKAIMREIEVKEGGYCDFVVLGVDVDCIAVEVSMYEPF